MKDNSEKNGDNENPILNLNFEFEFEFKLELDFFAINVIKVNTEPKTKAEITTTISSLVAKDLMIIAESNARDNSFALFCIALKFRKPYHPEDHLIAPHNQPGELEKTAIHLLLICSQVSLFGFLGNGLSLHITTTNSRFQNAYGTLCTAVLLCNIQTISIILIWGAIVLITDSRELSSPAYFVALVPGCLANLSLYGAVLVNLLIAVNRYCAFAYPVKYHIFWSVTKARRAGIIAYFLGLLPCFPNIFEPCTLVFNAESNYCWTYCNTTCGMLNSIFDITIVTSSSVIMGCINFVTFIKIRNHYKSKTVQTMRNNFTGRKLDLLFFKQTCVIGIVIITSSIIFFFGACFSTNKWVVFAVCTISWEMAHALEG